MTIMDATPTGEMEIVPATPETDAIVAGLIGNVWALLQARAAAQDETAAAGLMEAALVLLRAKAQAYDEAWRKEYVGLPTVPGEVVEPARGCTSMLHAGLSCAQALAEGLLPEGRPFCDHCSEEQLKLVPVQEVVEEGKIVNVVTPTDKTALRQAS